MSQISKNVDDIHPACNRPGCHRSPFDLLNWPLLKFGNHSDYFASNFGELRKELNKIKSDSKTVDGFEVCVDVQHFQPDEISVKTEKNAILVHAKHDEKSDEHGFISREFTRRYDLPEGFNIEDVVSNLSSDGILTVRAPKAGRVHHIPIERAGSDHSNVASNEEGMK